MNSQEELKKILMNMTKNDVAITSYLILYIDHYLSIFENNKEIKG